MSSIVSINRKITETNDNEIKKMLKELIEYKKKEKPDNIPYETIIEMFNRITGKNVRVTDANKVYIRARWREGYREEDFEKVVRKMNSKWLKDEAMYRYIRIRTLFDTKFDDYLNEPVDVLKEKKQEEKIIKVKDEFKKQEEEKNNVNKKMEELKEKYIKLSEEKKKEVQEKALERYKKEAGIETLSKMHEKIFESVKRGYVLRILEEI